MSLLRGVLLTGLFPGILLVVTALVALSYGGDTPGGEPFEPAVMGVPLLAIGALLVVLSLLWWLRSRPR